MKIVITKELLAKYRTYKEKCIALGILYSPFTDWLARKE